MAVNKGSVQYKFMTRVISSMKVGKNKNKMALHCIASPGTRGYICYVVNHDLKVLLNLFTYTSVIVT